jgi:hypothetical protein
MTIKTSSDPVPKEHLEQVGFVNWFRASYPSVLIYAVPNGEHRAYSAGKRLKGEGVTAGIPDLHVPEWDLWIEMKRSTGGRLSLEQRDIIRYLENTCGKTVIVGKGAADASRQVLEFVSRRN